jgi:hypothetical protein
MEENTGIFFDCEVLPPIGVMCETIARARLLERKNGEKLLAEEIFHYFGDLPEMAVPVSYLNALITLVEPIPSFYLPYFTGDKGQVELRALELHYQKKRGR